MTCTISLGPNNDFELCSPSGRRVYIPNSPHALQLLWQCLWNSTDEKRAQAAGFVAGFPTQAVVDSWSKELTREKQERNEEVERQKFLDRYGFDITQVELKL